MAIKIHRAMRIVRIIIWGIVIAVTVVAIGLYTFLRIRDSRSGSIPVHQNSIGIVKIALDDMKMEIGMNALMNPKYYWSNRSDTSGKSTTLFPDLGISMPANLYFFSVDDKTDTWYTVFQISDKAIVQQFLRQHLDTDSSALVQQEGVWSIASKNGRLAFLGDDESLLMCVRISGKIDHNQFQQMWSSRATSFVPINTLARFDLGSVAANVVYRNVKTQSRGTLGFGNGKIIFELEEPDSPLKFTKNARARNLPADNILNFYCDADLRPWFAFYANVLDRYNIPVDTLATYYGGYLDVQWKKGGVEQQETIVAYDYDDDFQPIEKKEIRKETVPNLTLTYRASPHLSAYIPEKIFYQFYKQQQQDLLHLTTKNGQADKFEFVKKKVPMQLSYRSDPIVSTYLGWVPFLRPVRSIDLQGKSLSNGKGAAFEGKIELANKDVHALFQLLND